MWPLVGKTVDFIPIVYDTLKLLPRVAPNINQDTAFVTDFVSIIDREGLWKRLRGTRGAKVDRMMKEDRRTSGQ